MATKPSSNVEVRAYRVDDAAQAYGLSRTTIYKLLSQGRLRAGSSWAEVASFCATRSKNCCGLAEMSPSFQDDAGQRPRARQPRRPAGARAFWQDVPIPKSRDICLLRPPSLPRGERFETLSDAARIDDANIARLLNFRPDLAAEIERCDEEGECASLPISARAARRYRRYFTAELLRIAEERKGPHQTATIYMRAFSAGELEAADLKLELEVLRKTLERSHFKGLILLGGTEVAWLARHNLWILHCHLLAIRVLQADWVVCASHCPMRAPQPH